MDLMALGHNHRKHRLFIGWVCVVYTLMGAVWLSGTPVRPWGAAFMVALVVVEELIFRRWLLSALAARVGVVAALFLSTAAFAAAHLPVPLASFVFVAKDGLIFGLIFLLTGRLSLSILFHVAHNAFVTGATHGNTVHEALLGASVPVYRVLGVLGVAKLVFLAYLASLAFLAMRSAVSVQRAQAPPDHGAETVELK